MPKTYIDKLMGEHEKILYITRQHWFVFLRSILVEILIALILVTITAAVTIAIPALLVWITFVIAFILLLIPLFGGVRDFLIWWNRQYIITNRRVIQIAGVINKNITDSSLEKVNDVKMEQSVLGRLFNFGNVEILTASELGANIFRYIGNPIHFKTAMLNAKEELERGDQSHGDQSHHLTEEDEIPTLIAQLADLRQKGIITETEFQAKKAELLAKLK